MHESNIKNFANAGGASKLSKLCHQMIASGVCAITEGIYEQRILDHLASFLNDRLREDFFYSPELCPALMETGYIIVNDGNDFLYPEDIKVVQDKLISVAKCLKNLVLSQNVRNQFGIIRP